VAAVASAGGGWQEIRPSADSVDGTWTDNTESTNLAAAIDEATPNDSDYIHSATTLPSTCRIKLAAPGATPGAGTRKLYTRAGGETGAGNLEIRVYQGGGDSLGAGTLVQTFTHNAINGVQLLEDTLTGTVTDWSNLYVELTAS
jgi:hypothetical protein